MTTPYMQSKYSLLQQRREKKNLKNLNNKQAQRQYTFEKLET